MIAMLFVSERRLTMPDSVRPSDAFLSCPVLTGQGSHKNLTFGLANLKAIFYNGKNGRLEKVKENFDSISGQCSEIT